EVFGVHLCLECDVTSFKIVIPYWRIVRVRKSFVLPFKPLGQIQSRSKVITIILPGQPIFGPSITNDYDRLVFVRLNPFCKSFVPFGQFKHVSQPRNLMYQVLYDTTSSEVSNFVPKIRDTAT